MTTVLTSLIYFLPWLLPNVIHLAGSKDTSDTFNKGREKSVALNTEIWCRIKSWSWSFDSSQFGSFSFHPILPPNQSNSLFSGPSSDYEFKRRCALERVGWIQTKYLWHMSMYVFGGKVCTWAFMSTRITVCTHAFVMNIPQIKDF